MDVQMTVRLVLLVTAALGSTVFVLDYLRTVDFSQLYARMVIALNVGISGILWISIFHRVVPNISRQNTFWISISLFAIVDYCLWYQWYLLRKARRDNRKTQEEEGN